MRSENNFSHFINIQLLLKLIIDSYYADSL